jgi:hypothetical protein
LDYGAGVVVAEPRSEREAAYGRFVGTPSRAELERFFFLDDADKRLVAKRRGDRNRLGFALQLGTVRFLGLFLADPTEVPAGVVAYVAGQVGAGDASCLDGYMRRRATRFEHTAEIVAEYGYRDFHSAEKELVQWLDDRAWTTGDGPTALFVGAVRWLRERLVLLPGLTTLRRLVGGVRDEVMQRLWDVLAALLTPRQARLLERLLIVADGWRVSDLERLRTGPTTISGKSMVAALERIAELAGLGFGSLDLSGVPRRRVVELARWGMAGKAPVLRRHPRARRLATLLATVVYLEAKAIDDALELFDVLMVNDLLARAQRQSAAEKVRQYPRVSRDAARLAAAVGVLFESSDDQDVTLAEIWEAIDDVVPRWELRAALESIAALTPAPQADPGGEWRALLVERYAVVRKFVPLLVRTIDFGATAEAAAVLDALRELPDLMDARATRRVPAGYLDEQLVALDVVPAGWWERLVMAPERPAGTVDRAAYVFCVLEQFHQRLRGRDIFATASSRWTDPASHLLSGPAWEAARGPVLNALGLPSDPGELLASLARDLDEAWRHVAGELDAAGGAVSIDGEGRLHVESLATPTNWPPQSA